MNDREYVRVRPACYMVNVSMSAAVTRLAETLGLGAESLSMKLGLSAAIIFPLVASVLYIRNYIVKRREDRSKQ